MLNDTKGPWAEQINKVLRSFHTTLIQPLRKHNLLSFMTPTPYYQSKLTHPLRGVQNSMKRWARQNLGV